MSTGLSCIVQSFNSSIVDTLRCSKLLFLVLAASVLIGTEGWLNDMDGYLSFTCANQAHYVSRISSMHSNHAEDRQWDFECQPFPSVEGTPTCDWSDYANQFDYWLDFVCQTNSYLVGASSYHNNYYEDRRWKFFCCSQPEVSYTDCEMTSYVNAYDGYMDYAVPSDYVITGVQGIHSNYYE
ncbi:hypothetical protein ScPMuIL_018849 [Solemya velum]